MAVFSANVAVAALVNTGAAKMFMLKAGLAALSLPAASVRVKLNVCVPVLSAAVGVSVPLVLL